MSSDGTSNRPLSALPTRMRDASTHSSILAGRGGSVSMWLYYYGPVEAHLRALGCRPHECKDLAHDVLIKLETTILPQYDPARPFRPYLKTAIRNHYLNHLRRARGEQLVPQVPERPDEADDAAPGSVRELVDYAGYVFDQFARGAEERLATGISLLQAALMHGVPQQRLGSLVGLAERQVRTHLTHAADALVEWVAARVNQDDLDELAALARASRVSFALSLGGLRGLFSHPSRRKRERILLILALIYRRSAAAQPLGG